MIEFIAFESCLNVQNFFLILAMIMAVLDDGFWNQRVQVFPGHDDVHLRWGRLRLQQVRWAFGSRFGKSSDCQ